MADATPLSQSAVIMMALASLVCFNAQEAGSIVYQPSAFCQTAVAEKEEEEEEEYLDEEKHSDDDEDWEDELSAGDETESVSSQESDDGCGIDNSHLDTEPVLHSNGLDGLDLTYNGMPLYLYLFLNPEIRSRFVDGEGAYESDDDEDDADRDKPKRLFYIGGSVDGSDEDGSESEFDAYSDDDNSCAEEGQHGETASSASSVSLLAPSNLSCESLVPRKYDRWPGFDSDDAHSDDDDSAREDHRPETASSASSFSLSAPSNLSCESLIPFNRRWWWSRHATEDEDQGKDESSSSEEVTDYEELLIHGLRAINPLLETFYNILPPVLSARSIPIALPIHVPLADALEIPRLSFIPVGILQPLDDEYGLSGLQIVRSVAPRDSRGYGLKEGSLWVMKTYQVLYPRTDGDTMAEQRHRKLAACQISAEIKSYMRISEAPDQDEKVGFAFLLTCAATISFGNMRCLILPLAMSDLRSSLSCLDRDVHVPRLMAQIALGLATLHSIGIIHCDLKPENVLLDYKWNVKLADFGGSVVTEQMRPLELQQPYARDSTGTIGYIAPEKSLYSESYGIEVDYWSLGCVFYEMLIAEERPDEDNLLFEEISLESWVYNFSDKQKRDASLPEGISKPDPVASALLFGLLNPNPSERYGIRELLCHPYFKWDDDPEGTSEFDHIEDAFEATEYPPEDEDFKNLRPRRRFTADPIDGSMYNWINARGAGVPGPWRSS